MFVTIELRAGPQGARAVTKHEMQRNIDALTEVIDAGRQSAITQQLLMDSRSILVGIQNELPR